MKMKRKNYYAVISETNGSIVVWGLGGSATAARKDAIQFLKPKMMISELETMECTRLAYTYVDEYGAMEGLPNPLCFNASGFFLYLNGEEKYPALVEIGKRRFRHIVRPGRTSMAFKEGRRCIESSWGLTKKS